MEYLEFIGFEWRRPGVRTNSPAKSGENEDFQTELVQMTCLCLVRQDPRLETQQVSKKVGSSFTVMFSYEHAASQTRK